MIPQFDIYLFKQDLSKKNLPFTSPSIQSAFIPGPHLHLPWNLFFTIMPDRARNTGAGSIPIQGGWLFLWIRPCNGVIRPSNQQAVDW
jgi:hypothetical protein